MSELRDLADSLQPLEAPMEALMKEEINSMGEGYLQVTYHTFSQSSEAISSLKAIVLSFNDYAQLIESCYILSFM